MSILKLTLPDNEIACTGKMISFKAPCSCSEVESVAIKDSVYKLVDAYVTVVLDSVESLAYIQNSANNPTLANMLTNLESALAEVIDTLYSHEHEASAIIGGTFSGKVLANKTAVSEVTLPQLRNISANTTELTSGVSELTSGDVYFQYE